MKTLLCHCLMGSVLASVSVNTSNPRSLQSRNEEDRVKTTLIRLDVPALVYRRTPLVGQRGRRGPLHPKEVLRQWGPMIVKEPHGANLCRVTAHPDLGAVVGHGRALPVQFPVVPVVELFSKV